MSDLVYCRQELCEIFLRIYPGKFHTLKFLLEGYDNLALLSSVAGKPGVVRLRYPAECAKELFALLTAIAADLKPLPYIEPEQTRSNGQYC